MLLESTPGIARANLLLGLKPTRLGAADLAEWHKGLDNARRVTPEGYFGDPAAAKAERGARLLEIEGKAVAAAVVAARAGAKEVE